MTGYVLLFSTMMAFTTLQKSGINALKKYHTLQSNTTVDPKSKYCTDACVETVKRNCVFLSFQLPFSRDTPHDKRPKTKMWITDIVQHTTKCISPKIYDEGKTKICGLKRNTRHQLLLEHLWPDGDVDYVYNNYIFLGITKLPQPAFKIKEVGYNTITVLIKKLTFNENTSFHTAFRIYVEEEKRAKLPSSVHPRYPVKSKFTLTAEIKENKNLKFIIGKKQPLFQKTTYKIKLYALANASGISELTHGEIKRQRTKEKPYYIPYTHILFWTLCVLFLIASYFILCQKRPRERKVTEMSEIIEIIRKLKKEPQKMEIPDEPSSDSGSIFSLLRSRYEHIDGELPEISLNPEEIESKYYGHYEREKIKAKIATKITEDIERDCRRSDASFVIFKTQN